MHIYSWIWTLKFEPLRIFHLTADTLDVIIANYYPVFSLTKRDWFIMKKKFILLSIIFQINTVLTFRKRTKWDWFIMKKKFFFCLLFSNKYSFDFQRVKTHSEHFLKDYMVQLGWIINPCGISIQLLVNLRVLFYSMFNYSFSQMQCRRQ